MSALDELIARVRRDLQENHLKRNQFDGARQLFHPSTWAEEASTVYIFVESSSLANMAPVLFATYETPALILIHPKRLDAYMAFLTAGSHSVQPGVCLGTYRDILDRLAPTSPMLLIVENGNELLDYLKSKGHDVRRFFQWSVGDYPLPNLHTHLIFQPH